jgi:uncharacterized membrane protein
MSKFRFDPQLAWPWSLKPWGAWALLAVAVLLVALTLWTYAGVKGITTRRLLGILSIRLLALSLACLMIVRPSFEVRELTYLPGQLLILYDWSRSMGIQDEPANASRWARGQQIFKNSGGKDGQKDKLDDLEKKNVTITEHLFDGDLKPYDPQAGPDGPRTDIGQALNSLYHLHLADKNLLAVVVVSDGADNGTRFPAITEAERWKRIPCRLYTVGLGKTTTFDRRRDLALTSIVVEPSPVPVKGKMTVRALLDAPGFENAKVNLRLKVGDAEPVVQAETVRKSIGNEIVMVVDAPAKPGEVRVTLDVDELPDETIKTNNSITTYATVTKEGISVLLVDRIRLEQKFIRRALESDPRFRVFASWRVGEVAPAGVDLFEFDKRQYDVIILGDLTPRLLTSDDRVLDQISELVKEKGVGLLMMGGEGSFGGSDWASTPIGKLLPVTVDVKAQPNDKKPAKMLPTKEGLAKVMMRLKEKDNESLALWAKLPPFKEGVSPLGSRKPEAVTLAVRPGGDANSEPLLVSVTRGEGRVLAFAGDETWRWRSLGLPKTQEGVDAHQRFWRQLVLFLAKQDEIDGAAWVKPEVRRLPAGSRLNFTVGLRGKGGLDLKDGRFDVKVKNPQNVAVPVETTRDQDAERGMFWKTEAPGEYKIEVSGRGRDIDRKEVTGTSSARFIVYQDEAEMSRLAADHDFLDKLARAGGGKFYPAAQTGDLFQELDRQTTDHSSVRLERWPDWDKEGTLSGGRVEVSGFLLLTFLLFTGLLCGEWFLRRRWGLV